MTLARDERLDLCALLDQTGPQAPTLCEGWATRDLAAHLVLREHRPDAGAGVMGGPLAGYTRRVQRGLAADLVLFDPDVIGTTGVRFVDDQPEGGRRLVTDAVGVEMSVVNGVVATRHGRSTGARSGRRLRPVG